MLLTRANDTYLVSIDNSLYISRDLIEWKRVLRLRPSNIIWHACNTSEGIIAQEYGEAPTRLYVSSNDYSWKPLLSNVDLDPKSRHFHYIAYDSYRDIVWITLGDGNLVRLAWVKIKGNRVKYEAAYRGPWQFVPIYIEENKLILGMDSGIAPGGIGIYSPEKNSMNVTFLEWPGIRHAQMTHIAKVQELWLATLGVPGAVITSKNLVTWYLIHVDRPIRCYNMMLSTKENMTVVCTGNKLMIIPLLRIMNMLNARKAKKVMYKLSRTRELILKLKGFAFILKRIEEYG